MAQPRQDIEEQFSASLKGVENEAFPVKNLAFKIFVFIFRQIRHFLKKISCFLFVFVFIIFIDVWHLCYQ